MNDPVDLVCPRCGLSIRPRIRWLTVEYCPRCIAYARIPVRMAPATADQRSARRKCEQTIG